MTKNQIITPIVIQFIPWYCW